MLCRMNRCGWTSWIGTFWILLCPLRNTAILLRNLLTYWERRFRKNNTLLSIGTYENICNRNLLSTHGSEEISERLLQKKITEFLQDGVHTETTVPRWHFSRQVKKGMGVGRGKSAEVNQDDVIIITLTGFSADKKRDETWLQKKKTQELELITRKMETISRN